MQYYWSLLKKKQLILFTFLHNNDYNLISIKINLFLFSISLNLTVNAFFFYDSTMHKIYIYNDKYSILYQIPQIIFSSVVSIILNFALKFLALSENDILQIKKKKKLGNLVQESKIINKCLISLS